jgi:hypothetical protein
MKSEKEINKKIDELNEKLYDARDKNKHIDYALLNEQIGMLVWVLQEDKK